MTASPSCELISPEYRREQRLLHETRNDHGVASLQYAPVVSALVAEMRSTPAKPGAVRMTRPRIVLMGITIMLSWSPPKGASPFDSRMPVTR